MPTQVTSDVITDSSVNTQAIVDSAVTAAKLAANAVTTVKITDANVTPAKLSQPLTLGTTQNSTSGTSIDFTGIPSWAKRITIMFNGVSTNGTSNLQIQIGTNSGFDTTGYASTAWDAAVANATTGFLISGSTAAANIRSGAMVLTTLGNNVWVNAGVLSRTESATGAFASGAKTLAGVLDRVRITTVNGTDAFDAGSINILYE